MWYRNNVKWQIETVLTPYFKSYSHEIAKAMCDGSYWTSNSAVDQLSFKETLRLTLDLYHCYGRGDEHWSEKQVKMFTTIFNLLEKDLLGLYYGNS